jgi:hypothetical protein
MLSVSDTPLSKPEQQRPALSQQADLSSVGVSAYGPSRYFAASLNSVAIGGIADIDLRLGLNPSVANDPKRTSKPAPPTGQFHFGTALRDHVILAFPQAARLNFEN